VICFVDGKAAATNMQMALRLMEEERICLPIHLWLVNGQIAATYLHKTLRLVKEERICFTMYV
jgi:dihydroxyacetone kinase DhaKLM complex PTS-EIIA-like component DhaM